MFDKTSMRSLEANFLRIKSVSPKSIFDTNACGQAAAIKILPIVAARLNVFLSRFLNLTAYM